MASITHDDALTLLREQKLTDIISPDYSDSVALRTFRQVPMSAGVVRMPVVATLPEVSWVSESATDPKGVKPTSTMAWEKKELIAEELAVIVPFHENLLSESDIDIAAQITPAVSQAFGRALDAAVFFGINKPTLWSDEAIIPAAIAAGNTVKTAKTKPDLAEEINQVFGHVETDGFNVNAAVTGTLMRARLRGLKTAAGEPIYLDSIRADNNTQSIYGQRLDYMTTPPWNPAKALMVVGDASKAIIGIREDVTIKLLDQATVGGIGLAERDMLALRFKFRVAFATAYSTAGISDKTKAYPFAVLEPPATA